MAHDCDINMIGLVRTFENEGVTWAYHVVQVEVGFNIIVALRLEPGSEAETAMAGRTPEQQSSWFNVRFFETFRDIAYLWPRAELCHVCRPPGDEDWGTEVCKQISATYGEMAGTGVRRIHVDEVPKDVRLEYELWKREIWESDPKTMN